MARCLPAYPITPTAAVWTGTRFCFSDLKRGQIEDLFSFRVPKLPKIGKTGKIEDTILPFRSEKVPI